MPGHTEGAEAPITARRKMGPPSGRGDADPVGQGAPHLTIRVDFGAAGSFGPGKARLLALIDEHGSIAAAGRIMRMSYRRAWLLVEEMNAMFANPLVASQHGGRAGGGATLSPLGRSVLAAYREIETASATACAGATAQLRDALAKTHED
ncbi:winged helix-turn-helix domain-containing protein [Segnochrobactrum spirostomi]|nr:LysR family transcriptional regulator [Segnochrobactrum spirostomi]